MDEYLLSMMQIDWLRNAVDTFELVSESSMVASWVLMFFSSFFIGGLGV